MMKAFLEIAVDWGPVGKNHAVVGRIAQQETQLW